MTEIKRARQIIFILGCDLSGSLRFFAFILSSKAYFISYTFMLHETPDKYLFLLHLYPTFQQKLPHICRFHFHFLLTHDLDDCIDHLFRPYLDSGIIISPHFQKFVGLEADSAARNIRNYNLRVIICRRSISVRRSNWMETSSFKRL